MSLPPIEPSPLRRSTGAPQTRPSVGVSLLACRYRRTPPPTIATITSLTVAPSTSLRICLTSSSENTHPSMTRWGVSSAWNRVRVTRGGTSDPAPSGCRPSNARANTPADGSMLHAGASGTERGTHEVVHHRAAQQRGRAWAMFGRPVVGADRVVHIGGQVVDPADDVPHRVPVDRGVVQLGEDRVAACGHAIDIVETLDHIHLPQRVAHVQRAGVQTCDGDAQLAPVGRFGQADVAHVELEVEMLVLDPVGVIEIKRHTHQAASEDRRARRAAGPGGQGCP